MMMMRSANEKALASANLKTKKHKNDNKRGNYNK